MRWWHKSREDDLEREIAFHLELEAEELQENGLSPQEARYAARRAFGNTTYIKEEVRGMWGWNWVERLVQDLRYSLRTARKTPAFAATVIITLALGIGINTAVFSVVNAVLLRKPSYVDPDRLVTLHQRFPILGDVWLGTSPGEYLDYRERTRAFAFVAGYEDETFDLTGDIEPRHLQAQRITHTLFSTLGVQPLLGRPFVAADESAGGAKVAILSYEFWRRSFGGSPQALGSVIRLNEQPYTVVGIMPAGFEFPLVARGMTRLLFGIQGFDFATFGIAAIALVVAALIASYIPARRASHIDPMIALRSE